MIGVVVDIDDTLIDTKRRMQGILSVVLEREIPLQDVEALAPREIFEKYATREQRTRADELARRFQNLLLCRDDEGIGLMRLDEPVPHAAEALMAWREHCVLVYLTGRLEDIREQTLSELEEFGFPTEDTELVMFDPEDWGPGAKLLEARNRLLFSITGRHDVVRAVDDFPGYFAAYRDLNIPDRIGLLRSRRFTPQDFIDRGATRVVESWEQLIDDLPKPK